jgi:glycosyltransferase involved in cell wall biosynthesis
MSASNLKVLHVVPTYFPATYWGGPIFSVLGLNNGLARLGVEVRVLTTDAAGPRRSDRLNVERNACASLGAGHSVYYTRRLAGVAISTQLLRSLPPLARWADLVHLTATYSYPTLPTLLICRALGKPLVWSPRGALLATHEWKAASNKSAKRAWEKACSFILRRTRSAFHVTSIAEAEASLARVNIPMAKVIRNGVEVPERLSLRTWTPDGRLRLLFLGRLDPKKGVENLIQALALLRDPTLTLSVCGTGEPAYIRRLTDMSLSLGLASQVCFQGQVNGEDKTNAFMNADVCVAPSHSENFCMVIAESLAHGVPVIASTGTPWKDVEHRGCGKWIENSPESLASGIKAMRVAVLEEMGLRGRQWMKEEFEWDSVAEEMCQLYQSLLAAPRAAETLPAL